jgi:signal transduction histidine kinase
MTQTSLAKILVVDDAVGQLEALSNTLQDRGYETAGFTSARDALAAMETATYDLLLTDLIMPEMDGIALLKAAQQKDPHLVVIVMTGEGTVTSAVEAMKSGALDYILKPFKLSAILPVLNRAISVRRLRLENAALHKKVLDRTAELEAANHELEEFSHSVSHDLRAPLRRIMGYAELLSEAIPDASPVSEYSTKIATLADTMSKLIDDLLNFSRSSRSDLRCVDVNLSEMVKDVQRALALEISSRNIIWKVASLPTVQADHGLLHQVLSNLIHNAVKYTRPRNPAEIEIGYRTERTETVIWIGDNGVGFDMAGAEKMFGVFQRFHRDDEFEGSGVGLANVKRIIARHGGRVWAEGILDGGAKFYFSLPTCPSKGTAQ